MTSTQAIPPDDPDKLANFEATVAGGDRIEAGEWMPQQYRAECLRLIQMHANSELMGALPEREWIPRAPRCAGRWRWSPRCRMRSVTPSCSIGWPKTSGSRV